MVADLLQPVRRPASTLGVVQEDHPVVRRPARPNSDLVGRTLDRLAAADVDWAPRFLGVERGEEVLSWLPGKTVDDWWRRPQLLDDLTRIVKQLHDMTADVSAEGSCLVHDDLQARNVVVNGRRLGLIDWEQLRPGQRVEDVVQLCWSFTGLELLGEVGPVGQRWRRVLDVYGMVDRAEVVPVALAKIDRCIADIVGQADLGSERHQRLRDRGDDGELGRMRSWLETNRDTLAGHLG